MLNRIDRTLLYLSRLGFLIALVAGTYLATTAAVPDAMVSLNDKLQHAAAFGVLGFLLDRSWSRARPYWPLIGLPLTAYGFAIECMQYFLPYRSFELLDVLADAAGLTAYWLLRPLVGRIPLLRRPASA